MSAGGVRAAVAPRAPRAPRVPRAPRAPRGPYANAAAQRAKILHGAREFFGQYGYWGASMREIARHVGMSQATMRHYFPTKVALLTAVLDDRDRASGERVLAHDAASSWLDALASVVADNTEHPNLVRLFTTLAAEATSEDHPAHEWFAQRYERVSADVARVLQRAVREGQLPPQLDVDAAARLALAVMHGLQVQWLLDPTIDMTRLFRIHLELHVAGAGAATTRPRRGTRGA